MKNKQVEDVFQSQLPLINECKQHLAKYEIHFALNMANRVTDNQDEVASTNYFIPVIPIKEIVRKKKIREASELVSL